MASSLLYDLIGVVAFGFTLGATVSKADIMGRKTDVEHIRDTLKASN